MAIIKTVNTLNAEVLATQYISAFVTPAGYTVACRTDGAYDIYNPAGTSFQPNNQPYYAGMDADPRDMWGYLPDNGSYPTYPGLSGNVAQTKKKVDGIPVLQAEVRKGTLFVTTAGGYTVITYGDGTWRVKDPNGNTINRVWGDPHLYANDSSKFLVAKPGKFVLPNGYSVSVINVTGLFPPKPGFHTLP